MHFLFFPYLLYAVFFCNLDAPLFLILQYWVLGEHAHAWQDVLLGSHELGGHRGSCVVYSLIGSVVDHRMPKVHQEEIKMSERTPEEMHQKCLPTDSLLIMIPTVYCGLWVVMVTGGGITW